MHQRGRNQICYLSEQAANIHLISEQGELNLVFYLISGGQHWNGEAFCARSDTSTSAVGTANGLHLGMTRADFEKVLGKPELSDKETLVYFRELKKKHLRCRTGKTPSPTSGNVRTRDPRQLRLVRSRHLYRGKIYHSQLNYLAVSKAETG